MGRARVRLETLRVRGYASVREVGDEFVGIVTQGQDYHEFTRDSLMEATHAVRDFVRRHDIRVFEIVVYARDGHELNAERGE